jgi:hypothetical protein
VAAQSLRPLQQLRQLGDVGGDAPRRALQYALGGRWAPGDRSPQGGGSAIASASARRPRLVITYARNFVPAGRAVA